MLGKCCLICHVALASHRPDARLCSACSSRCRYRCIACDQPTPGGTNGNRLCRLCQAGCRLFCDTYQANETYTVAVPHPQAEERIQRYEVRAPAGLSLFEEVR